MALWTGDKMRLYMTFKTYSKVVKLACENDENGRKSGFLHNRISKPSATGTTMCPPIIFKKEGGFCF